MRVRRNLRISDVRGSLISAVMAVGYVAICGIGFGSKAGSGAAMGIIAGAASVGGLWLMVRLMGKGSAGQPIGAVEFLLSFSGFTFKWILAALLIKFGYLIGPPAPNALIIGTLLVYSRVLGQAVVRG